MTNKKRKTKDQIIKHAITLSKKKKRANLSEILGGIYNEVDLSTTQSCKCHCCQVAMPQITYAEFLNIATVTWDKSGKKEKLTYLQTSMEYFFRHEFEKWGISSLVKPCMFLAKDGKCSIYNQRPLSCRMFGIWPKEMYDARVESFAKVYEKHCLSKEDLPLHKQCASVKRNSEEELSKEVVEGLYCKLQNLDKSIGDFSDLQLEIKENVRTFHDWLLLKVFGEDWLEMITTFVLAADTETQMLQLDAIVQTFNSEFIENINIHQ